MISSDLSLMVLHGLRLKGIADPGVLAELLDVDRATLEPVLQAPAEAGLIVWRESYRTGWKLTPAGRFEHEQMLGLELDRSGHRTSLSAVYEEFLPLNTRLLDLCTRWQVCRVGDEQVINDHGDHEYDAAVLSELDAVDDLVQPLLARLAALLDRFAIHAPRLAKSLAAIRAGDYDWLANPLIDSYHTVWFELHEDLLATLGLDRASETMATTSI